MSELPPERDYTPWHRSDERDYLPAGFGEDVAGESVYDDVQADYDRLLASGAPSALTLGGGREAGPAEPGSAVPDPGDDDSVGGYLTAVTRSPPVDSSALHVAAEIPAESTVSGWMLEGRDPASERLASGSTRLAGSGEAVAAARDSREPAADPGTSGPLSAGMLEPAHRGDGGMASANLTGTHHPVPAWDPARQDASPRPAPARNSEDMVEGTRETEPAERELPAGGGGAEPSPGDAQPIALAHCPETTVSAAVPLPESDMGGSPGVDPAAADTASRSSLTTSWYREPTASAPADRAAPRAATPPSPETQRSLERAVPEESGAAFATSAARGLPGSEPGSSPERLSFEALRSLDAVARGTADPSDSARRPAAIAGDAREDRHSDEEASEWRWAAPKYGQLADCLADLGRKYRKIRVTLRVQKDGRATVLVEALDAEAGERGDEAGWEPIQPPGAPGPGFHARLTGLGIDVVAEEAESALGKVLPSTPLDDLADLVTMMAAPETLMPKMLGLGTAWLACHAGIPVVFARLAGDTVEQAVKPVCQPDGTLGKVLDDLEYAAVTCDLADGEVTTAVFNMALDRLADQLKSKAAEQRAVSSPSTPAAPS